MSNITEQTVVNIRERLAQTGADPDERMSDKMRVAVLAHFLNGVPIERLNIRREQKDRMARVDHVYWLYKKNPYIDVHAMFYTLCRQHYKNGMTSEGRSSAFHFAKMDERVFWFAVDNMKPHSRKDSENKVRAATDKLMRIGMETDNVQALAKGAGLRIQLDRLDQPESERADMGKVAFLPVVVTTNIQDVDDTKTHVDDEQSRSIRAKYGAYVDDKQKAIEDKVATMEARSFSAEQASSADGGEEQEYPNQPE